MSNIDLTDSDNFYETAVGETLLIVGAPRFLGTNSDMYVATINDANDEQIVLGAWETRREAIGGLLNWAMNLVHVLESQNATDWVFKKTEEEME
jgi:hypothetical protein